MRLIVAGNGRTGSLVTEIARTRGHEVAVLTGAQNQQGSGLSAEALRGVDAVIDFTRPDAVLANISACARAGTSIVVGTTGWYDRLEEVRRLVDEGGIGLVYSSNFSVGMNLFFKLAAASAAVTAAYGYAADISEKHHAAKKDAPSGTAIRLQQIIAGQGGARPEISSMREGEFAGVHTIRFDSPDDTITLVHDAKTRRGFAAGAVQAAEWLPGRRGFYEFSEILQAK